MPGKPAPDDMVLKSTCTDRNNRHRQEVDRVSRPLGAAVERDARQRKRQHDQGKLRPKDEGRRHGAEQMEVEAGIDPGVE